MAYALRVETGQVLLFARSVGDTDPAYLAQLPAPNGTPLTTPLTYLASAEHHNPHSRARPLLPRDGDGRGGSPSTLHAEQHFEYVRPPRQGEILWVSPVQGRTWSRPGGAGQLSFRETVVEYHDETGALVARSRKVSVDISTRPLDE